MFSKTNKLQLRLRKKAIRATNLYLPTQNIPDTATTNPMNWTANKGLLWIIGQALKSEYPAGMLGATLKIRYPHIEKNWTYRTLYNRVAATKMKPNNPPASIHLFFDQPMVITETLLLTKEPTRKQKKGNA